MGGQFDDVKTKGKKTAFLSKEWQRNKLKRLKALGKSYTSKGNKNRTLKFDQERKGRAEHVIANLRKVLS